MTHGSSRPQFRSDLSQTPLPEVLATVYRYRVPGMVECTREAFTKRIYMEAGNIIFATSNNTADSLGDRLLAQGKITREQYDESVARIGSGGKRQGTILVEMRALEPKDLFLAVREQVQAIVWSIFEWKDGAVTFQPGRDKHTEFIKLEIPIHRAILEGVKYVDAKSGVARIGSRNTVLEPNDEAERDKELKLTEGEEKLLNEVDGKRSLGQLAKTPPLTAAQNAQLLYAFFVLRLIRAKAPKQIKVHIRSKS